MTVVWILLWTISLIIILKDYKTESTRWLASVAFITGLGAFSVVYEETIMQYFIVNNNLDQEAILMLHSVKAILTAIVHNISSYCMLIYGLSYADIIPKQKRKMVYSVLFIPPLLSFIFLPIASNTLRTPLELISYFRKLVIWAVPYMTTGLIFIIYAYFAELYGVTLDELIYNKDNKKETKMFARAFSNLSDIDKEEIMNLIEFKKKIKARNITNV